MLDRRFLFLGIAIKILLIPSYVSTDFEVHRNWLALTNSLPMKEWYYDVTSEWTLDYPPFFAWLEFLLGHVALLSHAAAHIFQTLMASIQCTYLRRFGYEHNCGGNRKSLNEFIPPRFLHLTDGLGLADFETRVFQKCSVIVLDLALVFAVAVFVGQSSKNRTKGSAGSQERLMLLTCLSPLLLIIDHIHFQYNGFLLSILILSLAYIRSGSDALAAFAFTTLINFKHIFLYIAPVYLIYYTRKYVYDVAKGSVGSMGKSLFNLLYMAFATIVPFIISLAPFINHLDQLYLRLFPFKRGLLHSYWAANSWAIYATADRILIQVSKIVGSGGEKVNESLTRGIVGDVKFSILPNIDAKMTFYLTLLFQLPVLMRLWSRPTPENFVSSIMLCAYTSFMFGWHVHEKAILLVLIPAYLLLYMRSLRRINGNDCRLKGWIVSLTIISGYTFFPLLLNAEETIIKFLLVFGSGLYFLRSGDGPFANDAADGENEDNQPLLNSPEKFYLVVLLRLAFWTENTQFSLFKKYPFLPLMVNSVYCALGNVYIYSRIYVYLMRKEGEEVVAAAASEGKKKKLH